MAGTSPEVRHVVAGLQPVRAITLAVLWAGLGVSWLVPHLNLSLRALLWPGLAAAVARMLVIASAARSGDVPRAVMGVALAADAVLLTALLDITGGPFNPFVVMFAAYVWAAAVIASPAWAVVVGLVAVGGFGWLVVDHLPAGLAEHHRLSDLPAHLFTMWFAAAGVVELVSHYVARSRAALAEQQAQILDAHARAARSERLASLTTLAAGAAHELSTPLSTIAVAARELERQAVRFAEPESAGAALLDDARLIRAEIARCQAILDGMSGRAGGGVPETLEPLTAASIAHLVHGRVPGTRRERLDIEIAPDAPTPAATGAEMIQAIASLITNAFDASADDARVVLRFAARGKMARVEVRDEGAGMTDDVLRRVGEPFYTTKAPGTGLGLGLFLVRAFAERSGGTLEFESANGTTAILEVPARSA
jgi:two-component system sensor histidine kinase RegB